MFFSSFPNKYGICRSNKKLVFVLAWKKKIFQISHINNKKNSNLYSLKIFKENSILKLLAIPILMCQILKYLRKSKKK